MERYRSRHRLSTYSSCTPASFLPRHLDIIFDLEPELPSHEVPRFRVGLVVTPEDMGKGRVGEKAVD
jgi:hypothetical protein